MTFLQPDCPPAAAEASLRILRAREAPIAVTDLCALLTPSGVYKRPIARMVTEDLRDIGLLEGNDDELVLGELAMRTTSRRALRKCLFASSDPGTFWESDDEGNLRTGQGRELVRSLAWFLNLDAIGAYGFAADVDTTQRKELDVAVVPTGEQWQSFARWGSFLGLTRRVADNPLRIAPDISIALAEVLEDNADSSPWEPAAIGALLARDLPVVGEGRFAAAVSTRSRVPRWVDCDLPSSVTVALHVLQARGDVELLTSTGDAFKLRLAHDQSGISAVSWSRP